MGYKRKIKGNTGKIQRKYLDYLHILRAMSADLASLTGGNMD